MVTWYSSDVNLGCLFCQAAFPPQAYWQGNWDMATDGISQLCLSKFSVVTPAQFPHPHARSCSLRQARGGKGEFLRIRAGELQQQNWRDQWGCASRAAREAAGENKGAAEAWRLLQQLGEYGHTRRKPKTKLWVEWLKATKRSKQGMLLQDRGIVKWLLPDADKWHCFTHIFHLLPLDKQSVLAGFFPFSC